MVSLWLDERHLGSVEAPTAGAHRHHSSHGHQLTWADTVGSDHGPNSHVSTSILSLSRLAAGVSPALQCGSWCIRRRTALFIQAERRLRSRRLRRAVGTTVFAAGKPTIKHVDVTALCSAIFRAAKSTVFAANDHAIAHADIAAICSAELGAIFDANDSSEVRDVVTAFCSDELSAADTTGFAQPSSGTFSMPTSVTADPTAYAAGKPTIDHRYCRPSPRLRQPQCCRASWLRSRQPNRCLCYRCSPLLIVAQVHLRCDRVNRAQGRRQLGRYCEPLRAI
mmetsp:Transcript_31302/g.66257  ORF Transcript_31302/g.66257 Transcript_31302/m.66257 type:complete len:280 (-) Transcript_31302:704-1543(-)